MPRHRRLRAAVAVLGLVAALTTVPAGAQSPAGAARRHRAACGPVPAERAHCHARVVTSDDGVTPLASTSPSGGAIGPANLRSAYQLPTGSAGSGMTIAIVDAYDNPAAETDLEAYRSHYGLPSCTTANGCFAKVNQSGATGPLPATDVGWAQEIDLDLQMASAVCPNCNIRLVEATTPSIGDLGTAVDTAADVLHAGAISNSYGGDEFSSETSASVESHYNHPGVAITVSSGDNGFGVQFPASSRYVTAVGGTSLRRDASTRGWGETAWSGAGSGCSAYVSKPAWQTDTGCARRTVADVSAVADPSTGVAVYDSFGSTGGANWFVFGGTSVAAPIVAGVYALGANTATISNASGAYGHAGSVWDVTSGTNAATCSPHYLCSAAPGYDGPTGMGTPRGTGAFGDSSEVATTTTTSTSTSTSTTSTTTPTSTSTASTTTSTTSTSTTSTTVPPRVSLQNPYSVWAQPAPTALDGMGTWLIAANNPVAGAGQVAPAYVYGQVLWFTGSSAVAILGLTTGPAGKTAVWTVNGPDGKSHDASVPFNWTAGSAYFVWVYRFSPGVWGAYAYGATAKTSTPIGQLTLPDAWGKLSPTSVTTVGWSGSAASACSAYPYADVYVYPAIGYVGTTPTVAGLGGTGAGAGDCPTQTSIEAGVWARSRVGAPTP